MTVKWRGGCCACAGSELNSGEHQSGETQLAEDDMRWTIQEAARALAAAVPRGIDPLARLAGVSVDSRTVARGALVVAIQGPRHDGHAFVESALAAGAAVAVVASDRLASYPDEIRGKLIAVPDTL